jgi:acyl-CoA reductase-like NAD-dependent aldehyde dehydrogenase
MAVTTTTPFYVAGNWEEGSKPLEVHYPYDHRLVGTTSYATADQARRALQAAVSAFEANRRTPAYERRAWLEGIRDGIRARRQEFGELMTLETGKPIRDSLTEVDRALLTFGTAAEEAVRINGEVIPLDVAAAGRGRMGVVKRFPIGPILAISPFNFPLNLPSHKIAPAIAAGNTVIAKPTSKTPLTLLKLAEVAHDAGLPPGILSIMPMDHDVTDMLLQDDAIKMLTFTGSSEVGWGLKARSGKKRVLMELGGNAAVIVDRDADIRHAAQRIVAGGFVFAGQTCISVQRVLVHERVFDSLARDVVELAEKLVLGDPLDEKTDLGPVIDDEAVQRINEWIAEAVDAGARVLAGGEGHGRMIDATVLADAPSTTRVCREEAFAPLINLSRFSDFREALKEANSTAYGLQAGVFTSSLENALEAFDELDFGGVMVNENSNWRIDPMPYGGVKDSGFGREGLRYAIQEMTDPKLLAINRV